jgi:hypothetical protein
MKNSKGYLVIFAWHLLFAFWAPPWKRLIIKVIARDYKNLSKIIKIVSFGRKSRIQKEKFCHQDTKAQRFFKKNSP